jgi:hypothetical protein
MVSAICANIGRTILAVAVLLTISVIQVDNMQQITNIEKGGRTSRADNWCPSHLERPDIFEASDKAKPLPINGIQ